MGKYLKYIFGLFALFIFILLFRAYLHQPETGEIKNNKPISFDHERSIKNLSRSIQFKTISHPDYEKFDQIQFQSFLEWLEEEYRLIFEKLEKKYIGKSLLLKWEGEDLSLDPILLTGHYDVVPVRASANEIWKEKPFSGKIDSDYVWGRGALDDKSGVIAIMEAVGYLIKNDFSPKRTVYFSFGHDEGSFLLENIIPGVNKAVAVINVAEKGSLTIQVIGKSKGGHSSMPESNSSVGYLAEALIKLEENPLPGKLDGISLRLFDEVSKHMPFLYKILFANLWLFEPLINSSLSNTASMNAVLRTTTAPTMLSASERVNVLASEAIGVVNFRLHPRDNPESVINYVEKLVANENIEVKQLGKGQLASQVSDWNTKGYLAISDSVKEVYGDIIVAPGLMVGGSDSKHYGKAAKNSFRFNPFPLAANELSAIHGIDERIKKDDFLNGIRSFVRIIQNGSSE
jgi:carboxypeptidase PM20D1